MEKSFQQVIVNNIRGLMEVYGWDYQKLANKSGISEAGIRKMITAQSFKIDSLEKISNAFGIPNFLLLSNLNIGHNKKDGEYGIILEWWFQEDSPEGKEVDGKMIFLRQKINPEKISYLFEPLNKLEDELIEVRLTLKEKDSILNNQKDMISAMMDIISNLRDQVAFYKSLSKDESKPDK